MFDLISFLSLLAVVHWQVNARVLPADSITLPDAPGFPSIKRDSSAERKMYIARNKDGCLVPSEKAPNTKRDDESDVCVGCSNVFVNSDSAAILPSGLFDGWKDAPDSKNTVQVAETAAPDVNLKIASSENSFLDDTPIVLDGMGRPSSGTFALASNANFGGNAAFGLDGAYDVAARCVPMNELFQSIRNKDSRSQFKKATQDARVVRFARRHRCLFRASHGAME